MWQSKEGKVYCDALSHVQFGTIGNIGGHWHLVEVLFQGAFDSIQNCASAFVQLRRVIAGHVK